MKGCGDKFVIALSKIEHKSKVMDHSVVLMVLEKWFHYTIKVFNFWSFRKTITIETLNIINIFCKQILWEIVRFLDKGTLVQNDHVYRTRK